MIALVRQWRWQLRCHGGGLAPASHGPPKHASIQRWLQQLVSRSYNDVRVKWALFRHLLLATNGRRDGATSMLRRGKTVDNNELLRLCLNASSRSRSANLKTGGHASALHGGDAALALYKGGFCPQHTSAAPLFVGDKLGSGYALQKNIMVAPARQGCGSGMAQRNSHFS